MLVLGLLLPPLTRIRPSGRFAVPGQNMSSPVLVTKIELELPLAGSNTEVYVWPLPLPMSPWNVYWSYADHITSFPLGRLATAMGSTARLWTPVQLDGIVAPERLHD